MRNKARGIFRRGGLFLHTHLGLLSLDCIEADSGMNPAEAAEEAPSDPDTDAFYKTGRDSRKHADAHERGARGCSEGLPGAE